jgi:hypothetical protein
MKKIVVLLVGFAFTISLSSQVDLETVWKKYVYPLKIDKSIFSADGNNIFLGVGINIYKMDAKSGEILYRLSNPDSAYYIEQQLMEINNAGEIMLTGGLANTLYLWDVKSEKLIKKIIYPLKEDTLGFSSATLLKSNNYIIASIARKWTESQISPEVTLVKYDFINDKVVKKSYMSWEL